jgi:hypothetical protein
VIQSCNTSHQISQTLKDENFIKSSCFMKMKKFEYCNLLLKIKWKKRLIFDGVMHRKQLYPYTPICLFLTWGVRTSKNIYIKTYNLRIITIIK